MKQESQINEKNGKWKKEEIIFEKNIFKTKNKKNN